VFIEEICRDTQSEDESESNNTTEEEESDDTDVTGKSGALLYCCNQGHFYDLRFPIYDNPCCPAHNLWLWLCSTNRKRVGPIRVGVFVYTESEESDSDVDEPPPSKRGHGHGRLVGWLGFNGTFNTEKVISCL